MLSLVKSVALSIVAVGSLVVAKLTETTTLEFDAGPEFDVTLVLAGETVETVMVLDAEPLPAPAPRGWAFV